MVQLVPLLQPAQASAIQAAPTVTVTQAGSKSVNFLVKLKLNLKVNLSHWNRSRFTSG